MSEPLDTGAIRDLVALMRAGGVEALEVSGPEGHLHLVLVPPAAQAVPAAPVAEAPPAATPCRAPVAGTLLTRHPASDRPLAAPDTLVVAGDVVALMRTGLLLRPVVAPVAGRLRWLAEAGTLVGYGAPLAEIEPNSTF